MTFAPGPWSIDFDSVGKEWTNSVSIRDAEGGHVAHLTRGYEGDPITGDGCPSWANARLIAAAPELLEALEYITEHDPDKPGLHGEMIDVLRSAVAAARDAIAKATGDGKP